MRILRGKIEYESGKLAKAREDGQVLIYANELKGRSALGRTVWSVYLLLLLCASFCFCVEYMLYFLFLYLHIPERPDRYFSSTDVGLR